MEGPREYFEKLNRSMKEQYIKDVFTHALNSAKFYEETAEITPEEWESLKRHVAEMSPLDRAMFKAAFIGEESKPGVTGLLNGGAS